MLILNIILSIMWVVYTAIYEPVSILNVIAVLCLGLSIGLEMGNG